MTSNIGRFLYIYARTIYMSQFSVSEISLMFGSIFQQNSCYNSIINTFWLKCRTLNSNAPYFNWYIYTHMYIYMYVYKACYMHTLLYINRKLAGNLCAFVLPSASFYPYYKSNSIPEAVLLLLLVLLRCFVCGFFLLENKFIFNIFFLPFYNCFNYFVVAAYRNAFV